MEDNKDLNDMLRRAAPIYPSNEDGTPDFALARKRLDEVGLRLQLVLMVKELRARGVLLDAVQDRELINEFFAMLPPRKSRQRPAL